MNDAPADARGGSSVAETLVALILTALVVHLTWSITVALRVAAAGLMDRSEALDTERVGWHVLSEEVAAGIPLRDYAVQEGRVLQLRAFRGLGEVCPSLRSEDGAVVRYRGLREPDPEKDSLLVLTDDGTWHRLRLVSREEEAPPCPGGDPGAWERWRWEPPLDGVLLARVFERGSYHIQDRALRYMSGIGGRQPLTPERLLDAGSGLAMSQRGLDLHLQVRADKDVLWESSRLLARMEPDG